MIPPITGHEGRFCIEGANPDDPYDCVPLRDGVLEHRAAAGGAAAGEHALLRLGLVRLADSNGAPPLADVRASALLLLPNAPAAGVETDDNGNSGGGAGRVALRYGPLPASGFGAESAADGLSISIGDGVPASAGAPSVCELAIALGGAVVVNRACGAALPRDAWLRLEAVVRGGRLRVALDGRDLLPSRSTSPGWAPAADWRLGGRRRRRRRRPLARPRPTPRGALLLYVAPVA